MRERGFVFDEENLLSPADALATYLAAVSLAPVGVEKVGLADAHGRVLATDILADADYPNAPRSAMDGFAVYAADGAVRLPIVGEITMGSVFARALNRGEAVRIPTGGVVPDGADAVVPIEDTQFEGDQVRIRVAASAGDNINPRGCDMRAGDVVLPAGTRIAAPQLGVFATLGVTEISVYRRPRVAVISSGDELIAPDATPHLGEIRDSNRYAIAGLLKGLGCEPVHFPTAPDEPGALEPALAKALADCDALVLTGGSSVGERDHTPAAIASLGAPGVIVHGLRVKPGKPTVLAAVGAKPVVGLPGNPTSAVIILQAVAAPIFGALAGAPHQTDRIPATLGAPARSRKGWTWYIPVELKQEGGGWTAHPLPLRSSTVSVISKAGGFIALPEAIEEYSGQTIVIVERFL